VLPMFVLPALSSMIYSILVNFTRMCKYLRTLVITFHIYSEPFQFVILSLYTLIHLITSIYIKKVRN
jgi:hypothetical protein